MGDQAWAVSMARREKARDSSSRERKKEGEEWEGKEDDNGAGEGSPEEIGMIRGDSDGKATRKGLGEGKREERERVFRNGHLAVLN